MSPFVPKTWQNGRETGALARWNAAAAIDMETRLAAYTDTQAGGGLEVVQAGAVTTNQTLSMVNRQEVLWIVMLSGPNVKLEVTGWSAGNAVTLVVKQNGVGGWVLAELPTALWEGGAIPVGSTAANAKDVRGFFFDGTSVYGFESGTGMA